MRNTFIQTLLSEAKKDKRIMLLTADLGFSVFEDYMRELPGQFINAGVSEQNMTGMAAGLAMEGYTPVIYSIIPFVTMRNFEQIRNDICYQHVRVCIVGVGAGFSYGPYGHTHHALEDIGIMRTIPEMTIIAPGDPVEVKHATRAMIRGKGPVYLRLGKAGEPILHENEKKLNFAVGKGIVLSKGSDVCIIASSTMLSRAVEVRDALSRKRISAGVVSMHTIKPIDKTLVLASAKKVKLMVTLEEHSVIGGLGSAVCEVLSEGRVHVPFRRIAVPDSFTKDIGMQEYMREKNGLSESQIIRNIQTLLARLR